MVVFIGLLFILRGLGLLIPFAYPLESILNYGADIVNGCH